MVPLTLVQLAAIIQDVKLNTWSIGYSPIEIVNPKHAIDRVSDNPGRWAFHCHNLYHMMAGMMRIVQVG